MKCPHCQQESPMCSMESFSLPNGMPCLAFNCPACEVTISIQIDPYPMKHEIINEISSAIFDQG